MKTVFISLVCTLNVQANVFSQHTKFDIAMKNVTVSEVLCYLEEISKYRFVDDSDAIDRRAGDSRGPDTEGIRL